MITYYIPLIKKHAQIQRYTSKCKYNCNRNLRDRLAVGRAASFALRFAFSVITFSLVNRFISYSHTVLLRSRPFQQHVALTFNRPCFQHCFFKQFVLKFSFSVITFSLVDRFTSYSHIMLLCTDMYTDMPHCDL